MLLGVPDVPPKPSKPDEKSSILKVFLARHEQSPKSKKRPKKTGKEDHDFTRLPNDLPLLCNKPLKHYLIARIVPKPRSKIPKGFEPYAHYLYHIGMPDHKTKACLVLKHNIPDLIDAGLITIDLSNQNIRLLLVVRFTITVLYPARYSHDKPFVIGNPGPRNPHAESLQKEYSCEFQIPKPNKPRFETNSLHH